MENTYIYLFHVFLLQRSHSCSDKFPVSFSIITDDFWGESSHSFLARFKIFKRSSSRNERVKTSDTKFDVSKTPCFSAMKFSRCTVQ